MEKIIDNKNGTYSFQRDGKILHTGKWGDKYVAPKVIKSVTKGPTMPTQAPTQAPKVNLFDFSYKTPSQNLQNIISKPTSQVPGTTGGGMLPPTPTQAPLPQNKVIPQSIPPTTPTPPKPVNSIDFIKSFYDNPKIPNEDKKLVSDAIGQGMNKDDAVRYLTTEYSKKDLLTSITPPTTPTTPPTTPTQKPSFISDIGSQISGIVDKTKAIAEQGADRLYQTTQEDFSPKSLVKGLLGTGEMVLAVPGAIVGQGLETLVGKPAMEIYKRTVPENIKKDIESGIAEKVKGAQEWYKIQTPQYKELLKNVGLATEFGLEIGGIGLTKKAGQLVNKGIEGATDLTNELVDTTKQNLKVIGKGIKNQKPGTFTVATDILSKADEEVLKQVEGDFVKGIVDGVEVMVRKPKGRTEKIIGGIKEGLTIPFRADDPNVLAGRAIAPTVAGLGNAQKVAKIKNVEKQAKELWTKVRNGTFKGSIDTLGDTAETVINNLKTVGAKIGKAIEGVDGEISLAPETLQSIESLLKTKTSKLSKAYTDLNDFFTVAKDPMTIKEAQEIKGIFSDAIQELTAGKKTNSDQYRALVKGVDEINTKIEDIIETQLKDPTFKADKENYKLLKNLVGDIVNSSMVEARRSPMTFTEQMGTISNLIDAVTSPGKAIANLYAREIGEMNTRGGSWKKLMEIYDKGAIGNVGKPVKIPGKPTGTQTTKVETNIGDFFKNKDEGPKTVYKYEVPSKNIVSEASDYTDYTKPIKVPGKASNSLIEEAKKYKSAEEFYQRASKETRNKLKEQGIIYKTDYNKFYEQNGLKNIDDYRGGHKAPNKNYGSPAWDVTNNGKGAFPEDIYSDPNAYRYYGHGGDSKSMDMESTRILKNIKGKPNADITIYRAIPKDINTKDINPGDWITLNLNYAKEHGYTQFDKGGYKILSKKVKVKDIYTDGNSIHEF